MIRTGYTRLPHEVPLLSAAYVPRSYCVHAAAPGAELEEDAPLAVLTLTVPP